MTKSLKDSSLPNISEDDDLRVRALQQLQILDTQPDPTIDGILKVVSEICGTEMAFVSLVDKDRQWLKSTVGLNRFESSRDIAICAHTINESKTFIIPDTHLDERFKNNPFVVDGIKIRFYAGVQLRTSAGYAIGTVCAVHHEPRSLSSKQLSALETLAKQIMMNLEHPRLIASMKQRETFIQNLLSMVPDQFSYLTPDYCYQFASPSHAKMYGRESAEIVGRPVEAIVGPERFAALKPRLDEAFFGISQDFQETINVQENGEQKLTYTWIHYYPDADENGKIIGVYSVHRDITQLKEIEMDALDKGLKLEEALHTVTRKEKLFRAIFDHSPIATAKFTEDLHMISCNEAYAKNLGYTREEMSGMSLLDYTLPQDVAATHSLAKSVPLTFTGTHRLEKQYRHKDGFLVLCLVTIKHIKVGDGKNVFLSIVEDITDIRRKEDQLRDTQAMLMASAKMASLGEMAGSIAHEINNPLAIINFKTDMIQRVLTDAPVKVEAIEAGLLEIKKTAKRIAKIVKGLRHFSRSSEGDPMEVVPFSSIMKETMELCDQKFRNSGIDISTSSLGDDSLECRPTQISQIIMNLLSNAFDAVSEREEPWIRVSVVAEESFLRIRVIDCGKGISSAIAERIMQPFYTTKDVGHGTGLGLSISNTVALSHKGRLYYELYEGHTSFVLDLPKVQPVAVKKISA
ncbi:MAG: PAS domain S-box protein [Proteobacteria bacterium]|nr:MAG: PAS domain S-box protein [Pseudomonadota bacterium]